jgi:3',5'-cyclic AMP phosphodiesterase CpdA
MTLIAHISDTHFGTEVNAIVTAMTDVLEHIKPDITILSGDITQRARKQEFALAKEFFNNIYGEIKIAIPGNHDIPLYNPFIRFLTPYKNYEKAFKTRESLLTSEYLAIVCCDATNPYRHTKGKLELDKLRDRLERARKNLVENALLIVVIHQPLLTALSEDRKEALINAEATAKLFEEYKVDLVLSGHVHFPLITTTNGFTTLDRNFILSGAGTAISHRTRSGAPNSFNMINIKNQHLIEIIQYEFQDSAKTFTAKEPILFGYNSEVGWLKI